MSDMIPAEVREMLMPLVHQLRDASEHFELTMDTGMAIAILVGVLIVKFVQKKPDRTAQEALERATPPDLRSLSIAGGMLAFYLLCAPMAWLAMVVPQAELPSEDELLALELEPRADLGVKIYAVVASGSGWPAAALCAAAVGKELADSCVERAWDQPSSTPEEIDVLTVVDGLDAGPDALALVLFPCAVETPATVHVGAASIAWACLPADTAEQAMVSALMALRSSLVQRAEGVQAVANAEALGARLAPVTRIVLTLALEDGLASDIVSGWEGGVAAVHDGIALLSTKVGLALGGRSALEGTGTAPEVQTESHVVRHVDVVEPHAEQGGEGAETETETGRRLHLHAEDALRHLELPGSYTPNPALQERRWSFVAVMPSDSNLGWAASSSDTEQRDGSSANAVVVPGRGGIVALPAVPSGGAGGSIKVNPSTVLQIVAQQCRQLLGLPESTVSVPSENGAAVSVVWETSVGTEVMTETELSLVCLAREGAPTQGRVLGLLRQLVHLAQERDEVLVPPQVAYEAHAAVAALQEASTANGADCGTRLGLQLGALRSMIVRMHHAVARQIVAPS